MRLSISLLSILVLSETCRASDFNELIEKAPQGANAVMAVDVTKTLQTPFAKMNGWDKAIHEGSADRPLYLPPEADKLVAAAQIDITRDLNRSWEVSLFGLLESMPLGLVARAEGGYVDKIEDVEVAWLPSDAYVLKAGETTLMMQAPADRQAVARWISSQKSGLATMQMSDYLGAALAAIKSQPHVVMALDTSHAIQRHRVEENLQQSGFLEKHSLKLDQVADLITSLQGIVIEITFTDKATAMARIDFAQTVPFNKTVAKALVLATLESKHMSLPGSDSFTFSVVDKSIIVESDLLLDSVRRILSLMEPPSTKFSSLKNVNVEKPSGDDIAQNSLAYFHATQSLIKDLRKHARSYNSDSYWMDRYVKKIDSLPILHVDNDLLDYGEKLSETLESMSGARKNDRLQAGVAARGDLSQGTISNNYGYGSGSGYGYGNYSYSNPRSRETAAGNDVANAAAAGTSVKIQGWELIDTATIQVRRGLTMRYNIEF